MFSISSAQKFRAAAAGLAVAIALAPSVASASPETIQRALGNIIWFPFDIALSPIVAGQTLYSNLRDIDDTMAVRVVYTVPGYIWLTGLQVGAGAIRGLTGGLEVLPGILLIPFEADLDPLFDPVERGDALVEYDNDYFPIKFGVNYQSPSF